MSSEAREKMLDALERASTLYVHVLNDRRWPLRSTTIRLLQYYIRRLERRLAARET